jgi:hypothetical protein
LFAATAFGASIRQHISFSPSDLEFSATDGKTQVMLPDCELLAEPGAPQLLRHSLFITLPPGARVTGIRIVKQEQDELAGDFDLPIAQPPAITMEGIEPRLVKPDPEIMTSDKLYPQQTVELAGQGDLRGKNIAMVTVYPLHYLPLSRKLSLVTGLDIELDYRFGGTQSALVSPQSSLRSSQLPGGFDYLIVTNSALDSVFQRLADWKTLKGVKAVVRHIDWIEANYAGRDPAERLRNYLKTCYPDSGLQWLLLGGDTDVVPLRYAFAMACSAHIEPREDSLPCDLYFSDLKGDWDLNGNNLFGEVADSVDLFPDVYVGRAPVSTPAEARVFVNKVLTYEQNPPLDYENTALFCGEVLWQNPYTDQGIAKNWIDNQYVPARFKPVHKLYQSQGTENLDTVLAELNQGRNFFNHDGHGGYNAMSVGGYPNYLYRENMDSLTNAPRYGICYSIGCWTTAFDLDAVAEHFVRAPNGGGVAFIGNSSYGWGAPGNPRFGYSDRFDAEFYHQVFTDSVTEIGKALALDKVHFILYSREANVYRWHQYQVNLLGDPEMPIWTDTPHHLVLDLPSQVPVGATIVRVTVCDSATGLPVPNALVCAWHDDYAVGRTDISGCVSFSMTLATSGDLLVTATALNYLYHQGQVPVITGPDVVPARVLANDSAGNSDGIVNPGEDISYQVWFRNDGNQPALGLTARLRCTVPGPPNPGTPEPLLLLLDSVAALPNLAPAESALAVFAFSVNPLAQDRDVAYLDFRVSDDSSHTWTARTAVTIGAPALQLKDYLFTDSAPGGNGNQVIEPGEQVKLNVRLHNTGLGFGYDLHAQLTLLDPDLQLINGATILGTIAPDSLGVSELPFEILVDSGCPSPHTAWVQLGVTGSAFQESIPLMVGGAGFTEDFDSSAPGWEYGGARNLWHLSQRRSHSPDWSLYCGDESLGCYDNNMACWALSPRFVNAPRSELRFWREYSVPIYGTDGLYVIIDHDSVSDTLDYIGTGGDLPRPQSAVRNPQSAIRSRLSPIAYHLSSVAIPPSDGVTSDWLEASYDLSRYQVGETLRVRFGFKSDNDGNVAEGFYVDDIRVTSLIAGTTENLTPPLPEKLALLPNYPNPFGRMTSIVYQLPYTAKVTLGVYSIDGRLVRRLADGTSAAGYHLASWSGLDDRARRVPAGVYICRLFVNRQDATTHFERKLALSR